MFFLRLRPWAQGLFLFVGITVTIAAIPFGIYAIESSQQEAHAAPTPVVMQGRELDGKIETTGYIAGYGGAQTLNLTGVCGPDAKTCKTLVVQDNSRELMSVDPHGNVHIVGDLTVNGKINGAAPACPVYVPPPPVICKAEPSSGKYDWLMLSLTGGVWVGVILLGVKVFRELG